MNNQRMHVQVGERTKIETNMGVLMIHQNTSVFSMISQHLAMRTNKQISVGRRFNGLPLQLESRITLISVCPAVWGPLLPHIVVLGLCNSPSCDENRWPTCW